MNDQYESSFYSGQSSGSVQSAEIIVPILNEIFTPKSVVDIGCGVGGWLLQFRKLGVDYLLGIDGSDYAVANLLVPDADFKVKNFEEKFALSRRYDLAICLEVAEHLPQSVAAQFIKSLTGCSDVVYFSAAIPFQGGIGHRNEQWQKYWVELFANEHYKVIDLIRPQVWDDDRVKWWYAQNGLVFASETFLGENPERIASTGNELPLDIVHPKKYLDEADPARSSFRRAMSLFLAVIKRKLGLGRPSQRPP